jgi:hypothetical protein
LADVLIGQGIAAAPRTGQAEILWNRVRRSQYTLRGFPASTTTPFSGNTPAGILVWDGALNYVSPSGATPGAEFEMTELAAIQLIISNNGSGQTLSGITLSDYDTLPSGIAVPGQGYTVATNLATGASVSLSALNLANNAAIRLLIPVNGGCLRQLYIEPTYAAAVTAGTGSLEVRSIPEYSQFSLKGSRTSNVLVNVASVVAGGSTAAPGAGTVLLLGKYTKAIALTAAVTYGGAITAAPSVNVYTSPDGVSWDTDPFATFSPSYAASTTRRKTILLDGAAGAVAAIAVQVVNNDGADALGAVLVTEQEVD